ncbi:MAG TPA: hypothetical protein PKE26_02410 [Kiritimatiellia bacterium]|nr:hypothetical protein [Kiritimatiellia bacterium]HMO97941.1 hypothetical protein [Kiritimatiellia bacterium]HMP95292.1 hypothetical protein [Kiritimatiellia bacterium]
MSAPVLPPKLYTDPSQQNRFESFFTRAQASFIAPTPGMLIRAETKSGGRIDGEFIRYTADGLVMDSADGYVTLTQAELTEKSQQELFVGAFSRQLAERQMVFEAADGKIEDEIAAFFLPTGTRTLATRRFTADRMVPRVGPGRQYAAVEGVELFRGQNVFVVDEVDGWIAVKNEDAATRAIGWIPKFSSFLVNPENAEAVAAEVDTLKESGFIVSVDPRRNEALVDLYQWRISDSASVEGKSRLLAFYCGQQKGVRLFWVDIKDSASGRRLAEYSESKGFKVF